MICIVYGGESCEHDISVITALSVYNAIKRNKKTLLVYQKNDSFYIGKKLSEIKTYKDFSEKGLKEAYFQNGCLYVKSLIKDKRIKIECAVMCNHGGSGEDGGLSGYFETVGVPYTASGVFGSGVCMDKVYTKLLLEKLKFPTVNYRIYRAGYKVEKIENMEFPLIIKPARSGSSVGIAYANDGKELRDGIDFAIRFDDKLLIEKALTNFREFNCAVFEGKDGIVVSEVEEVFFKKEYLDFYDKYMSDGEGGRKIPAQINEKLGERIKRMTKEIYLLLELKGVVRVDYMYCEGKLYVNEINTIPGALANYMFRDGGIDAEELVDSIIYAAKKEFERKRKLTRDFSSNVLKNYNGIKEGIKK
ncbi:MAG: hypothetical protein ACI4SK_01475 [Christensenellales bacterium]